MILNGFPVAKKIYNELKGMPAVNKKMVVVSVGNDTISQLYVEKKSQIAEMMGVKFEVKSIDSDISEKELLDVIDTLNKDSNVGGYIIQIPLPRNISREIISRAIDKEKDIDGFRYIISEEFKLYPPTVLAIVDVLSYYKIDLHNKKILIVGNGFLVGRPLYKYMKERSLDAGILRRDDPKYYEKVASADIIISATGRGGLFKGSDFKRGSTVIDASTVSEENSTIGDVSKTNWPSDKNLVPVPGGIGPVTVAELFKNFYKICQK